MSKYMCGCVGPCVGVWDCVCVCVRVRDGQAKQEHMVLVFAVAAVDGGVEILFGRK